MAALFCSSLRLLTAWIVLAGACTGLPIAPSISGASPLFDGDGPSKVSTVLENVDLQMDPGATGCSSGLCSVRLSFFGEAC